MALSPQEASEALREIHAASVRSQQHRTYRDAAPHLFVWGFLWLVGYGATALWPRGGNAIWASIVVGWALAALLVVPRLRLTAARVTEKPAHKLRPVVASLGVGAMLVVGTALILHPRGRQVGAYVPLVVAVAYLAAGIWGAGPRYAVLGAALFALTLFAYLLLPAYFLWVMAAGGCAALALTGVWLRSA